MALPNGIQSTQELLDAQAHIWKYISNSILSQSLKCAIQLGIPDIIHKHGKPITLPELKDALQINESKTLHLQRFMRMWVHSKFFTAEEAGYWLTPASRLLLRDEPLSTAQYVVSMLDLRLNEPWDHMCKWFRSDRPTPFEVANGMPFWEAAGAEEGTNRMFNDGMASDSRLVASVIVRDYPGIFAGLRSMVDVGGGNGTVAAAVAEAFPGLKCSVLDLPHVVAGLEGTRNLEFVGGDMFEAIPPADAVFLKWILHDWSDEECVKILKKCKEAIGERGKVIIVEMVVDENKSDAEATQTQFAWDLSMMIVTSGRERNQPEWENLFHQAGFTAYKFTHLLGLRSVIELFP